MHSTDLEHLLSGFCLVPALWHTWQHPQWKCGADRRGSSEDIAEVEGSPSLDSDGPLLLAALIQRETKKLQKKGGKFKTRARS